MKKIKLRVPGCYKILSRRLKCAVALGSYTVIERDASGRFEIQRNKYATDDAISLGLQYLNLHSSVRDLGNLRREVGPGSIECACALYGGIVFMLDTELLSVWNEIPEGYGLVVFESEALKEEKKEEENHALFQVNLISHALARNLRNFSTELAVYQQTQRFWEGRKDIVDQSLFWGVGEDGRCFSVMPRNTLSFSGQEILEIDTLGLQMVSIDD